MIIRVFKGVYPPAEDTFFLASWLDSLPLKRKTLLDVGTGSGYLAILGAGKGARVTASDIQSKALLNTRYNARLNGVRVRTVLSNIFENIHGTFDVIVFNPPYLTPLECCRDVAWDGGWRIIRRFLDEVDSYLSPGGCYGFVMEEDDHWDRIKNHLGDVKIERNAFHLIRVTTCL